MAEGLLGRIGSALKSPTAQGLLMAGATGFNPLLGLLAAPAIASGREREELRNEEARAAIRSRQQENEARQRQMTAQRQIPGLLRSAPPQLLDPSGDGLLAQPGAERTFQNRQMGILADLSPDAAGQALLQQMQGEQGPGGRLGDAIKTLEMMGEPVTFETLQRLGVGGQQGGGLGDAKTLLEIQKLKREEEAAREAGELEQAQDALNRRNLLTNAQTALESLDVVKDTFLLRPGGLAVKLGFGPLAAEAIRSGAQALGEDAFAESTAQEIAAFDKFNKSTAALIGNVAGSSGQRMTDFQTKLIERASAGERVSPVALSSILTDLISRELELAEITRQEIPPAQMESLQSLLNKFGPIAQGRLESEGAADIGVGGQVPAPEQIPGFDELSPEEQDELRSALQGGT